MRVFIILAHPSHESFTHQVYETFCSGLKQAGHDIIVSDLYQMGWRAELSLEEYQRESTQDSLLPVPEDVIAEQRKWNDADAVVFIYPLWWSDVPAKLKGWFDRVYTYGFAYREDAGEASQKVLEKAWVLCVAGHPADHLQAVGLLPSMERIMVYDRIAKRAKNARFVLLGGQGEGDAFHKEKQLEKVRELAKVF